MGGNNDQEMSNTITISEYLARVHGSVLSQGIREETPATQPDLKIQKVQPPYEYRVWNGSQGYFIIRSDVNPLTLLTQQVAGMFYCVGSSICDIRKSSLTEMAALLR